MASIAGVALHSARVLRQPKSVRQGAAAAPARAWVRRSVHRARGTSTSSAVPTRAHWSLPVGARCRGRVRARSTEGDTGLEPSGGSEGVPRWLPQLGLLLLWAALLGYATFLSPNQTPYRDQYFVEKLVGLGVDDGVSINAVFAAEWNLIAVTTMTLAALLIPAGRSANSIPAWPFVLLSQFFGAYVLMPYMALWSPSDPPAKLPLPPEELGGWRLLALRPLETPVVPLLLCAAAAYFGFRAVGAGGTAWVSWLQLFDESRLVHVSSLDLVTLVALTPFWMYNDATLRQWKQRDQLLPVLSLVPWLGPALYLLLRPKTFPFIKAEETN